MTEKAKIVINDYLNTLGSDDISTLSTEEIDRIIDSVEKTIKKSQLKKNEIDSILEYFRNSIKGDRAQYFCEELKDNLTPYFDLEAFRGLSLKKQKTMIKDVFDRYVLSFNEEGDYTEDEIEKYIRPCRRALNTIMTMAIGYNATEEQCIRDIKERFVFSDDIAAIIVNLFMTNKIEMREIYKLRMIASMSERIRSVEYTIDKFLDLLDDDDDNKNKE